MAPAIGHAASVVFLAIIVVNSCFGCNFIENDYTSQTISEDAATGVSAVNIFVSNDVTAIDFEKFPSNSQYLSYALMNNGTNYWVELIPKDTLKSYYDDRTNSRYFTILQPTLTCGGDPQFTGNPIIVSVTDENNRPPEFDPSGQSYTIDLPYQGGPINWKQVVRVYDQDFENANTEITFDISPPNIITVQPERYPGTDRLEYYELYYYVSDKLDTSVSGLYPVTITASNQGGLYPVDFVVQLQINASPDTVKPSLKENPSYYATAWLNEAGSRIVASVQDDRDLSSATIQLLDDFAGKFSLQSTSLSATELDVSLTLNERIDEAELEQQNYIYRLTLVVTDAAGNANQLPLVVQIQADEPPTVEEKTNYHSQRLKNEIGSEVVVASATDDNTLPPPVLGGDLVANFQAKIVNNEVIIALISPLDPNQLLSLDNTVRLTLEMTDSTGLESHKKSLPVVLQFEKYVVTATVDSQVVTVSLETSEVLAKITADPPTDLTFSINPSGKVTIDSTTGEIKASYTDDEIVEKAGQVEVYTVTVDRLSGAAQAQVTVVLNFKPDDSLVTTEPPVTCPTTAEPVECTCPTTETPITCPSTPVTTDFTCPPTETPITCPPTECTCPTTETPVTCPPTPPTECTCAPTDTTQTPITCPPPTECYCSTTETPVTCPPTPPPTECPTTCPPPTECPTTCPPTPPPTECPTTCPPTPPPTECPTTCPPTPPPTEFPTTCPPTPPPTECPTTCPPTPPPTECPITCPATPPPGDCDCSTTTGTPGSTPSTCPPPEECNCSTSTTIVTTVCPTTSDPPSECDCSTTSAPNSTTIVTEPTKPCPTTCPPPIDCPVCPPPVPPCEDECEDCDCRTTGLVAGVAVASTIAVAAAGLAAYLAYQAWAGGASVLKNLAPTSTEIFKPVDPEMGSKGSAGGAKSVDKGTFGSSKNINGSLKGPKNGSVANGFGSVRGGTGDAAITTDSSVLKSTEALNGDAGKADNFVYQNESMYASPAQSDYTYIKPDPDATPTVPEVEQTSGGGPVEETTEAPQSAQSTPVIDLPDTDPPAEPKVDYNRVDFKEAPEVIETGDEALDVDETGDTSTSF